MFDIGGWEFLVIAVLAIVIIGPKDLPTTVRTLTGWVRRARELARDFQSGLDEVAREVELDEIKNTVSLDDIAGGNSIRKSIENAVDPDGELTGTFKEADNFLDNPMGDSGEREDGDDDCPDAIDDFDDNDDDYEDEIADSPDDGDAVVEAEPEPEAESQPDGASRDNKAGA